MHPKTNFTDEHIAQLPVMLEQIGDKTRMIASAALNIAGENERLISEPEMGNSGSETLAEAAAQVVRLMNVLQDSALNITDNAALLVQLISRVYSHVVQEDKVFLLWKPALLPSDVHAHSGSFVHSPEQ